MFDLELTIALQANVGRGLGVAEKLVLEGGHETNRHEKFPVANRIINPVLYWRVPDGRKFVRLEMERGDSVADTWTVSLRQGDGSGFAGRHMSDYGELDPRFRSKSISTTPASR